jgi:hypothetical protein
MLPAQGIESSLETFSSPSDSAPDSSGTVMVMPVLVFSVIVTLAEVCFDDDESFKFISISKTGGRKVSVGEYVSNKNQAWTKVGISGLELTDLRRA